MRLLISVADATEVCAALAGGADVVDVKNPAEGALGAATPATLRAVRGHVSPPVETSAALGDAPHLPGTLALAAYGAALCGVDYLKVGLLGSRDAGAALQLLRAVRQAATQADPRVRTIAVAYADAARAGTLAPRHFPRLARAAGFDGVMLDTLYKDGTSTFAALGEAEVEHFTTAARAAGLALGIAGSLGPADLPHLRRIRPDIVGVRGAVCNGGRDGTVSAARVRELRGALGLSAPPFPASSPGAAVPAAARGADR